MKAVILAAGLGSRLRPLTDDLPKCMVPVNGIPIIDKQLDNLLQNKVEEIYVVDGYKADILSQHLMSKYPQVKIINNQRYAETNNMYSLFLASEYVKSQEFLLMNADVYFDTCIIDGLLKDENQSKIACDCSKYLDESMKITVDGGRVNHISKQISEKDYYAVSIDVYRISSKDSTSLYEEIENTIIKNRDEKSWTEVALDNVFPRCDFRPYDIGGGRWFEIDNHDDLRLAEQLFLGDTLCER